VPIKLKVNSEFNEPDAVRAVKEAKEYYKQKDAQIKLKAQFDEAAARATTAEVKRYFERQSAKIKIEVDDRDLRESERGLVGLIRRLNEVGRATAFTARGLGTIAAPAVGLVLIDVAKGAVTASQSIALLPAVVGSAAAAFGTLKLATLGFGDAMKEVGDPEKFAVALQGLAPSAQQAALSIRNLLPEFKALQLATQDALFAGMGEQIHRLTNEYLPEVRQMTTGIADAFNQMLKGVGTQLMTPETQGAMQTFMTNTVAAFQNLAPAVAPLTKAFADLMAAGSDFLPGLARSVAEAATQFSNFITRVSESGELRQFIQDGIDAVKVFGQFLWDLGGIIYQVFASDGKKNVETLRDTLKGIGDTLALLSGDVSRTGTDFRREFDSMYTATAPLSDALRLVTDAVLDIPEALTAAGNAAVGMANMVVGQLNRIVDAINLINPFSDVSRIPEIPNLPESWGGDWGGYTPLPSGQPALGGLPGAQRERRGRPPLPGPNPFAGPPPFSSPTAGLPPWTPSTVPTPTPAAPAGGGGPAGPASKFSDYNLQPNAARANDLIARRFPQIKDIGGWRASDPFPDHPSGNALDIMIPGSGTASGKALGDQINAWLIANKDAIGLVSTIWQQKDHYDHIHALFKGGPKSGSGVPSGGTNVAAGDAIPVFVTNMPSGGFGGSGAPGSNSGAPGGSGPGGTGGGPTDLLGAFFKGLSSGGGWGGIAGSIGTNILGMASEFSSGGTGLGAPSVPSIGPVPIGGGSGTNWDAIAQKESGGDWGINTGNGYYGGLQFQLETWRSHGGVGMPQDASREEQIRIAENVLQSQGPGAWPNTYKYGAPGFTHGGGVDNIPAMLTAGEHVLTKDDVNALGGQGGVYALRNALHRQGGGEVWLPGERRKSPRMEPGNFNPNVKLDTSTTRWSGQPWASGYFGRFGSDQPGSDLSPYGQWLEGFEQGDVGSAQWLSMVTGENRGWMKTLGVKPKPGIPGFAHGGAVGFQTGGPVIPPPPPPKPPPPPPPPPKPPPAPTPGVGAAAAHMAAGAGFNAIQGHKPGEGGWQPGKPAGGGGGVISQAASMFPGGGLASQLALRAIEFGGQALAIGASGLMETFLPSGSALGDPSKSWFGKLASGFGGARPATANTAGKAEPVAPRQVDPNTTQHGTGMGQPPGPGQAPLIGTMNYTGPDDGGQAAAREINRQVNAYGAGSER